MRKLIVTIPAAGAALAIPALAATTTVEVGDNHFARSRGVPTGVVHRNDTVRWRFGGDNQHNVVVARGPLRFSSPVSSSGTFSRKLTRRGTWRPSGVWPMPAWPEPMNWSARTTDKPMLCTALDTRTSMRVRLAPKVGANEFGGTGMRRTAALAAVTTVGVGAAIAFFSTSNTSGQAPVVTFTKQTFTVQEKDTNDFGFLDNAPKTKVGRDGPRRLSPADQLVFHSKIVEGGKVVGGLYAHCTVVTGGTFSKAAVDCTGTFQLASGSLFVSVGGTKIFSAKTIEGAVTGGNGAYAGATGSFSSPQKDNTTDTFTIYLPTG